LRHGLLRGSFIPTKEVRQWRDLTRLRKQYVHTVGDYRKRTHKLFESANIKIDSVVSDLFGVTGRNLMNLLVSDRERLTLGNIERCVRGKLRGKEETSSQNRYDRGGLGGRQEKGIILQGQVLSTQSPPWRQESDDLRRPLLCIGQLLLANGRKNHIGLPKPSEHLVLPPNLENGKIQNENVSNRFTKLQFYNSGLFLLFQPFINGTLKKTPMTPHFLRGDFPFPHYLVDR
jgi:hypothetical protein